MSHLVIPTGEPANGRGSNAEPPPQHVVAAASLAAQAASQPPPSAPLAAQRPVATSGEPTQRFSALQQQLLCPAIHFFHRHIRSDPDVLQRMEGNQMFRLFFEVQYHNNKPDLNRIFPDSVHDSSPLHVCSFILSILHQGIFSVSAFIVSVIYLSRFKESSHITLHACTWRPLFLTSLLLADKMWEDKPVRNSSLAKLFPVLNNAELNRMENRFLNEIRFNVLVKPDLFCSFCEKLLGEQVHAEITRCVNTSEYAATLLADSTEVSQIIAGKQSIPPSLADPEESELCQAEAHKAAKKGIENAQYDAQKAHHHGVPPVILQTDPAAALRSQSVETQPQPHPTTQLSPSRPQLGHQPQLHSDASAVLDGGSAHAGANLQLLLARNAAAGHAAQKFVQPQPQLGGQTLQPPRSISAHPLHRTESNKKHPVGKADDPSDKGSRLLTGAGCQPAPPHISAHHVGHNGSGPPSRRSLPAKTSNPAYTPLARTGISANRQAPPQISSRTAHHGDSSAHVRLSSQVHQPSQSSSHQSSAPASSQVGGQAGRSASQPLVTPSGSRYSGGGLLQQQQQQQLSYPHGASGASSQITTPPVPMPSQGIQAGQASSLSKPLQQQRGTSPGGTVQSVAVGNQPARASSAPRVSGVARATPPGPSSVRTTANKPIQVTHHTRGQMVTTQAPHAPGSPSASSPMVTAAPSPIGASHYGAPSAGVYPASPSMRGSSPVATTATAGGLVHRGVVGSSGVRNASPMGVGTPSTAVSATNQIQMNGNTTRGRSPPPGVVSMVGPGVAMRQPRAATPGSMVKAIPQGNYSGYVQRTSLSNGPVVVHRGIG